MVLMATQKFRLLRIAFIAVDIDMVARIRVTYFRGSMVSTRAVFNLV